MKSLRWIRNLRGRHAAAAAIITSAGGMVLTHSATSDAIATPIRPHGAQQDRLARIATLLTADTDARLARIATLLTAEMDAA